MTDAAPAQPRAGFDGAFVATGLAFAVVMFGTNVPSALYGLYAARFGLTPLMVTVVFATFAAGVLAALIFLGRLSDQIGRQPVILAALALSAGSAVCFLLADGVAVMLVGRALTGLSAGLIVGTGTAALGELAPPSRKGQATVVAVVVNLGGLAAGVFCGGVLADLLGDELRSPYWVDLGLIVVAGGLVALLVPETVARRAAPDLTPRRPAVAEPARAVFARSLLVAGAGFGTLGLLVSVSGLFLGRVLGHHSIVLAGVPGAVAFGCAAVGQLLVRRTNPRRALPAATAAILLASGCVALALQAELLAPLLVAAVLAGLGAGAAIGSGLPAVLALTDPPRRAEAASAFFIGIYVALATSVVGIGVLVQISDIQTAGTIFAGLSALVTVLVLAGTLRSGRLAR
jgi:predicted MFS family arabinose efflux permease